MSGVPKPMDMMASSFNSSFKNKKNHSHISSITSTLLMPDECLGTNNSQILYHNHYNKCSTSLSSKSSNSSSIVSQILSSQSLSSSPLSTKSASRWLTTKLSSIEPDQSDQKSDLLSSSTSLLPSLNANKNNSDMLTTTAITNNNFRRCQFKCRRIISPPNHGLFYQIQAYLITILLIILLARFDSKNLVSALGQCSYPGSPAHASVAFTNDKLIPGTIATYTCDNGYELLGPSRRVCHQNGTWTPLGIPFCVLNVAVGKAAMQSSTVGQGHAQKAVDGSPSSFFNPSTCTMTEAEPSPWFYVNLLEPVLVQLVRIDFGASCCQGRPATITVRVGNNRPDLGTNPLCRKFTGFIEEGRPLYLPCTRPMAGAFVSIQLESTANTNPLSICELFVYTDHALSIEQCPTFRDQPLGGTSTYDGKCYIFYNEHPLNFENAKKFCEVRGGNLVDETSPALQGFLSWELYRRHRNDPNGQYWLGAVRDPRNPQNWKWINGKDLSISFWNLPMSRENCSRFDGTKGWLWSDTNCNLKLNYMCQHRPLSCGRPERPPNSTVLIRSVDVGQTIEYHCNDGHLLIGPNLRTCMSNGFFSEYAPKCKYIECGPPQSIPNGIYLLNNKSRAYMSSLSYQCNDGYVLVGRGNLICDVDGLWNGPPPRCEPVLCPNPPMIANGFGTLVSNSTRFDSIVEYACDPGYELVGEKLIQCNRAGYWEGQPGYCVELIPSTQSSSVGSSSSSTSITTTTSTPAPTFVTSSNAPTTAYPTTFFDTNPVRGFTDSKSNTVKPPQIALLPINNNNNNNNNNQVQTSQNQVPHSNVYTNNPYNTKLPPFAQDQSPSSVTTVPSWPSSGSTTVSASIETLGTSSTVSSSTTTGRVKTTSHQHNHHQTSIHLRPHTSQRPSNGLPKVQDNEIPNTISNSKPGFIGKPSKIAAARLNMGGIIALAIFGGFVFLAAVITIIVIIVRRIKHSHSSLDAQTISTFDSSNGDNTGFYHKYASAWSQLQSSAVLHSGSYKPANMASRLSGNDIPYEHHHYLHGRQRSSPNGGSINEGFRDNGPDSDIYTRSADRRNNNLNGSGGSGAASKRNSDHDWQHVSRTKY